MNRIQTSAEQYATQLPHTDSVVVAVVGLGYVGLQLCLSAGKAGHQVIGIDVDPVRCKMIANGDSYLSHISSSDITQLLVENRLMTTTDYSHAMAADVILICVPTPLTPQLEPDLSFIKAAVSEVAKFLRKGHLIILESTTYPGTTDEVIEPELEKSGLLSGRDFHLAYSPERENPGDNTYKSVAVPKVVGANCPLATDMAVKFYRSIYSEVVEVASTKIAEAVKLTENTFRHVNIGLINELKMVFDRMGIDIWDVVAAAKTKPFGFMPFYPGPGVGGHCIPVDPHYLSWKAREYRMPVRFIDVAWQVNTSMPQYVLDKLSHALDRAQKKTLGASKILLIGIAYKKNIGDVRESPGFHLLRILNEKGASVDFYDPFVEHIPDTTEFGHYSGLASVDWNEDAFASYDATIIVTDHDSLNLSSLVRASHLIIDTRNACRSAGIVADHIISA
jgi:UDP-N-acetyl-D-glucosamine dehydrogenase